MFLLNNFDIQDTETFLGFLNSFSDAVSSAFSAIGSIFQFALNVINSFLTRLSNSNTLLSSFTIVVFMFFVIFTVIKIWRS